MVKLFFVFLTFIFNIGFSQIRSEPIYSTDGAAFKAQFLKDISPNPQGENLIGYIYIGRDRAIDDSTFIKVKFSLDHFKKQGVKFVLLHLNTPGGEVHASMNIADHLIKFQVQDTIPVIAFIDSWALSAGAMLAYACKFIAIERASLMGAAEPIMQKDGEIKSAPEKINSALRAEFGSLARFFARNPLVAEAMVDKDIILVERNQQIVELQNEDEIQSSDRVISRKGKLLTLDAQQMAQLGIANVEVPFTKTLPIKEEEKEAGRWPASKSPLFQIEPFDQIPEPYFIAYRNWKITFFTILSHPIVSFFLIVGLILGTYIEMSTPGFGFFGVAALICISLILMSSFAIYTISWLEVLLLCLGVVLLLVELLILPGFGFTGILGISLIVISLIALLLPINIDFTHFTISSLVMKSTLVRLAYLCAAIVVSFIVIVFLYRFLSLRLLSSSGIVLKESGGHAHHHESGWPKPGSMGITETALKPAGKVMIEERLYDAVSDGVFLEEDTPVKVIRVEGNKIVVSRNNQ